MKSVRSSMGRMLGYLEDVSGEVERGIVDTIRGDISELESIAEQIVDLGDVGGWGLGDVIELAELVVEGDGCLAELIAFFAALAV